MATIPFSTDSNFLQEVRDAVFLFARKHCGSWATTDECEDLTQEAMMKMYEIVRNGNLKQLNCSLSTYVNGILKNLAKRMSREKGLVIRPIAPQLSDDEDFIDPIDMALAEDAIRRWTQIEQEEELTALQEGVRDVVINMKDPCKTLLWAFYWEGKSMRTIAEELEYNTARVATTQLSRCRTKVKTAMEDIYQQLRS